MTGQIRKLWFVTNVMSGSYDERQCEHIVSAFERAGWQVAHVVRFPEEDLPDRAMLEREGVDTLAIFTGDGTINSLLRRAGGWDGSILVLPGGTMNLLCKSLHSTEDLDAIIARAATDARADRLPIVDGAGEIALTGIIAGPTACWGEVREAMRHVEVSRLAELVPDAWRRSMDDEHGVILDEDATLHAALFVTPHTDGLHLSAFTVDDLGEVARHGLAWLSGDFRSGPHIDLGSHEQVTMRAPGDGSENIAMLVDGEQASAPAPLHFERRWTDVRFLVTADRSGD